RRSYWRARTTDPLPLPHPGPSRAFADRWRRPRRHRGCSVQTSLTRPVSNGSDIAKNRKSYTVSLSGQLQNADIEIPNRQATGRALIAPERLESRPERRSAGAYRPGAAFRSGLRREPAAGSGADDGLQRLGPVGALPGEVRLLAAEVPVGSGLRVDRAQQ